MTASESSAHPPVRPSHESTCALVPSPIPSHSRYEFEADLDHFAILGVCAGCRLDPEGG